MRRGLAAGFVCLLLLRGLTSPPVALAGQFVGETPTYAREVGFESHFFYKSGGNGDGQIQFICRAFPGTTGSDSTASSVWQVQQFTYDSSHRITDIEFAGDDDAFASICDNRASLNYD